MKIIVEEGDEYFTHLKPGTYDFGAREFRMEQSLDCPPGRLGRNPLVFTLVGEIRPATELSPTGGIVRKTLASGRKTSPKMCTDCGAGGDRSCTDDCPRVKRLPPAARAEWDARRKRERERKKYDDPCRFKFGGGPFVYGGAVVDAQGLAEVYSRRVGGTPAEQAQVAAEAAEILRSVCKRYPIIVPPADLGDVVKKVLDGVKPVQVTGEYVVPPHVMRELKCDECGGTGEWENPANGRRSPCSRGCPCKS